MDDVNKMMNFTVSGGATYEGTITQDKSFSGSWWFGSFSLSYLQLVTREIRNETMM